MSDALRPCRQRLLCPWDSPGKNTGVGCHSLFRGSSLTQGLNPGLLHFREILYLLSHQGSSLLWLRRASFSSFLFLINNIGVKKNNIGVKLVMQYIYLNLIQKQIIKKHSVSEKVKYSAFNWSYKTLWIFKNCHKPTLKLIIHGTQNENDALNKANSHLHWQQLWHFYLVEGRSPRGKDFLLDGSSANSALSGDWLSSMCMEGSVFLLLVLGLLPPAATFWPIYCS